MNIVIRCAGSAELVFVCLGLSISYDVAVLFFSQICLMFSLLLLAVFYFNAAAIYLQCWH